MANEVPMTAPQTALDLPALVRTRDYRRFLAIQFADPADRAVLYALSAFAGEMAEIPHHVREPLAGFMRFAWWREALQAMEQGQPPRAHPLLQTLAPWLAANSTAFAPLYALIESGQRSLEDDAGDHELQVRESAQHALWELALTGRRTTPLEVLKSLPLGQRIGPMRIAKLMLKGLAS